MFDNLVIVAVIAIVLWVGLFVFYLISSRQQQKIERDLQDLEKMLGDEEQHNT